MKNLLEIFDDLIASDNLEEEKRGKSWIDHIIEGVTLSIVLIVGFYIGLHFAEFDGENAQFWFNAYDSAVVCIQESDNPRKDCI